MQEQSLYEYAVIRVLPVVEREEYLNVGVFIFCNQANFISFRFIIIEVNILLFS